MHAGAVSIDELSSGWVGRLPVCMKEGKSNQAKQSAANSLLG